MPVPISQLAIEEPDSSFPKLPQLPPSLAKDPANVAWWAAMNTWWNDAIRSVRAQIDNP